MYKIKGGSRDFLLPLEVVRWVLHSLRMVGENEPSALEKMLRGAGIDAVRGFRLGPGTVGNLALFGVGAVACLAVVGFALSGHPVVALAAIALIVMFCVYFCERAFRFAEKHPAEALMGGTEYFQYLRDRTAAKNTSIVIDAPSVNAGPVEQIGKGDE